MAWVFAVVLAVVFTALAVAVTRSLPRDRAIWGPPLVALGVSPVLLAPWWLPALWHGAGSLLLMETGRQPYPSLGFTDLLVGRFGSDVGGPWWLGALLVVLAVLALIPRATRIPVLVAWLVAAVAALTATALSFVPLPLPGGSVRPGIAVMLVVLHGCFVLAAMLGAQGLVTILRRSRAEHHQVLLVVLAVVAAIIPAIGLGWFVWQGPGDLASSEDTGIPAYMTDASTASEANGILVIRGDVADGLRFTIRRGDGDTLGENEIQYASEPDPAFTADVQALVSRPTAGVVVGPREGRDPLRRPAVAGRRRRGGRARRHRRPRAGECREPYDARLVGRPAGRPARDGRPRVGSARGAARGAGHRGPRGARALPPDLACQPTQERGGMSRGKRMRAPEVVRRSRTPRLDLTTVLAVVIPLVTVGLLALVRIPPVHDTDQPPSLTKLTNALLVCPSGRPGSTDAAVSTASGASGDLSVLADGQQESVPVTTGATSPVDSQDALVVRGSDELAPGLVGLRSGTAPLSALACTVPSPEQWFTGVGSRADHDSVIELVNPDAGPAVADITLLGPHLFSTGRLRGILIPGHKTITVDLGTVVPRRTPFTAHVVVSRGRLAVDVLDSVTDLVTHRTTREWLPRQLAPATTNELLGPSEGRRAAAPSSWPTRATTSSGPRSRWSPATPASRRTAWRRSRCRRGRPSGCR